MYLHSSLPLGTSKIIRQRWCDIIPMIMSLHPIKLCPNSLEWEMLLPALSQEAAMSWEPVIGHMARNCGQLQSWQPAQMIASKNTRTSVLRLQDIAILHLSLEEDPKFQKGMKPSWHPGCHLMRNGVCAHTNVIYKPTDICYIFIQTYSEMSFSLEKEGNPVFCDNMDVLGGYHALWNKPVTEEQISHLYEVSEIIKLIEAENMIVLTRVCGGVDIQWV